MYGISAFAQAPFAALGGNYYPLSITESLTSGDSYVDIAAFLASITEATTLADSQTAPFVFSFNISENLNSAETESVVAALNAAIVESLSILDANITGGWNTIDDTQNAQWGGLTVTITAWGIPGDMLFGGAPIAGQLINITTASAPVGATPVIVWQDIVDTNTPGWTFINDTQ